MRTAKTIVKLACLFASIVFSSNIIAQDLVADNMLMFQREYGGWPKHYHEDKIDYNKVYAEVEKATIVDEAGLNDATIDNDATCKEIKYLLKVYKTSHNKKYLDAAERGIKYLLKAQYANGGWPQFYPDLSSYHHEITFNDNAMINVMNLLYDLSLRQNNLELVDISLVKPAADAVKRGIDCILKTQVKIKGKLTVWCAQYNEVTYAPAKARAYELPSLSGAESVGVVEFLMRLPSASDKIKLAITSAVDWFESSKITGLNWVHKNDASALKGFDRVVVKDASNTMWARFYDLDTNEPFFCGRDGVKKKNVSEIEYERRTGYAWYGTWPKDLIEKKYPEWIAKNK